MKPRCPACGHLIREGGRLTPRELEVLAHWWMVGSVKGAAAAAGVGEQRAKNMLRRARIRNQVPTNDALLEMHFVAVRATVSEKMQHNANHGQAA